MKLSDLRPCDRCGAPFDATPGAWIHVVRVSGAIVGFGAAAIAKAAVEWHGGDLKAAEESLPDGAADVVRALEPEFETTLFLCRHCLGCHPIASAAVARVQREELLHLPTKGLPS